MPRNAPIPDDARATLYVRDFNRGLLERSKERVRDMLGLRTKSSGWKFYVHGAVALVDDPKMPMGAIRLLVQQGTAATMDADYAPERLTVSLLSELLQGDDDLLQEALAELRSRNMKAYNALRAACSEPGTPDEPTADD